MAFLTEDFALRLLLLDVVGEIREGLFDSRLAVRKHSTDTVFDKGGQWSYHVEL